MTRHTSTLNPTLGLTAIALAVVAFRAGPAASQDEPFPALMEWRKRVTEAKGLDDETRKRDAMFTLVREALSGREVRLSGTTHNDQVHPDDNQPAPVVNFDPRLNQKSSAQSRQGTPPRSLQGNFGYYFSYRGAGYVVIGPAALDPRNPVFTRIAAEHELFHAKTHVGDDRPPAARELETWTQMFVTYFHEVMPYNQRWAPMLAYYDNADEGERKVALDRLATYYRTPPGDEVAKAKVRAAFEEWLARRKKDTAASKLVSDLEKAIAPSEGHGIADQGPDELYRGLIRVKASADGRRLLVSVDLTGSAGADGRPDHAFSVGLSQPLPDGLRTELTTSPELGAGQVAQAEQFRYLRVSLESGRRLFFYMPSDRIVGDDRKQADAYEAFGFAYFPATSKGLDLAHLEKMTFSQPYPPGK